MKAVCFDVDGTLLDGTESIWRSMHKHLKIDMSKVAKWHKDYLNGKITYYDWVMDNIDWWKKAGATKKDFLEVIKQLSIIPGARRTINLLKKKGMKLAIISGSLNLVVEHFFPAYVVTGLALFG